MARVALMQSSRVLDLNVQNVGDHEANGLMKTDGPWQLQIL